MPIVGLAASMKVSVVGLVRVMSGIRVGLVDVVDGLGMLGSSVGFVDDDPGRLVEDGCAAVPFSKCCSITSLETKEFLQDCGIDLAGIREDIPEKNVLSLRYSLNLARAN